MMYLRKLDLLMNFVLLIRSLINIHGGQTAVVHGKKNVGWSIDYQVITPNLKERIKAVDIYKKRHFSAHAPSIVDYDI